MNKMILRSVLVVCAFSISPVFAEKYQGACATKEQQVLTEIEYAKQHNNTNRLAGLQSALDNLKKHCKDSEVGAELEAKVKEKETKVAERQAELNQEKLKGNTKKIAKREKKLAEAQQELTEAQAELKKYQ